MTKHYIFIASTTLIAFIGVTAFVLSQPAPHRQTTLTQYLVREFDLSGGDQVGVVERCGEKLAVILKDGAWHQVFLTTEPMEYSKEFGAWTTKVICKDHDVKSDVTGK